MLKTNGNICLSGFHFYRISVVIEIRLGGKCVLYECQHHFITYKLYSLLEVHVLGVNADGGRYSKCIDDNIS